MSDYQWVLPRISVGGFLHDYDVPQLRAERIGYIINAGAQHPILSGLPKQLTKLLKRESWSQ